MSGPPELKVYGVRGKSLKISFALISYRLILLLDVKGLQKVNPNLLVTFKSVRMGNNS